MERGLKSFPNDGGRRLTRPSNRVVNGSRSVLLIDPVNDRDLTGIIIRRANPTVGTGPVYGTGQALEILDSRAADDGTIQSILSSRLNFDGGGGLMALHVAPGINGSLVVPSVAAWIQNLVNSLGLLVDGAPTGQVQSLFVVRATGTVKRLEFNAAWELLLWNDDASAAPVGFYSANTPSLGVRGIFQTRTDTTMGLYVTGTVTQTADLQEWLLSTTVKSRITKGGNFATRVTVPADGDVASGEAALGFTPTNSAASFDIKAKETGGTVRALAVPLPGSGLALPMPALSVVGLTGAVAGFRMVGSIASGAAPSTGTFIANDTIFSLTHGWLLCTAGGSPGTWRVMSAVTPTLKSSGTLSTTGSNTEDPLVTITDVGQFGLQVDCNALDNGEELFLRAYGKVLTGGTERLINEKWHKNNVTNKIIELGPYDSDISLRWVIACSAASQSLPWKVLQT